jgi:tripartite-type tricarboxylate transporter receptor subunit TctC
MKSHPRPWLVSLILSLCVAVSASVTRAQEFPVRAPKIMVPFTPGGAADTFARLTGQKLGESWGKQVIIENRPGAGGIIATEATAKGAADGYSYLIVTVGHVVNPSIYATLPYDTLGDFTGVALVATVPNVLVVHPSVPVHSARDLIKLAKSRPGQLSYASSGTATTSHMAAVLFAQLAGIEMLHVPYKGAAPAVQDLVAGRVAVMLDPTVSVGPFIQQGRLRPLAVTTGKRTPLLPDLPTLAEAGLPGYEFQAWFALIAPAKSPPAIVQKMNQDVARVSQQAEYRARLAALGAEHAAAATPSEINAFLRREVERWAKVARDANIKVE